MADMSRLLNAPRTFTFEKPYKLGERLIDIETAFQVYLEDRALKTIQRHRDKMAIHEFQQQEAAWRQECAAGVYEYGMPVCLQALMTPQGQKEIAFLTLSYYNREPDKETGELPITRGLIEQIWQNDAKWLELTELLGALNDPNRQRPETPASESSGPSASSEPGPPSKAAG